MKTRREKEMLLGQLKKTPIVQIACEKAGVGRATYYRWRKEDAAFTREADAALEEGAFLINDMAESQLISAIKEKNMGAIIYWLRHHHPVYTNKLELVARMQSEEKLLTPEQQKIVEQALRLAGQIQESPEKEEEEKKYNGARRDSAQNII